MTSKNNRPGDAAPSADTTGSLQADSLRLSPEQALRRQAEAKLGERKKKAAALPAPETDIQRLIYELEVHQIELEMQNKELVQSRTQVEAGLRQYTDLYDFAPVGYFTLALDGAIHQVNLAGANLLGVEHGALIKRRFGVFVSTRSRTPFSAFLEKVFSTSGSKETCEIALREDGAAPLWVHIEAMTEDGQRKTCRAVVVDITERKRAEEALRESETKLQIIFNTVGTGILIIGRDTQIIIEANQTAIGMTGLPKERIMGQICHSLVCPAQIGRCPVKDLGQTVDHSERKLIHADGHLKDILKTVYPIILKGRDCYVESFIDITERKRMESKMQESEQKFRTLFEDSIDAIYITTKEGRFIDFNQGYLKLFGYTKEEMVTIRAKDTYINPADRDIFKKMIDTKGSVKDYEVKLRKKDGQQMDCIITATTRYADDGSISGYQGIIKDITEQKRLEQQLHTMSLTDELTGLYSRRGFFALAQQQLKVTERTKKDLLLFFVDLDKMKQINDTSGHQEGDNALVEIATILKEVFRESDIMGRIGGDEFAILAIDTNDEIGEVLTMRLHNTLDDYNRPEGRNYTLSLSIGIAHYNPERPFSLDELMAQADTLMYEEKRNKQH
jgi:diguanylate cyclase (GGDEF)-like protein/PAS domain S-box-containing protein